MKLLIKKLAKQKGTKIVNQTNDWMEETCSIIRENFKRPESKKIFTISFLVSIASWSFYGISFMIIAIGTGLIFASLLKSVSYAPDYEDTLFTYAALGFAFVESFAFFCFGGTAAVFII